MRKALCKKWPRARAIALIVAVMLAAAFMIFGRGAIPASADTVRYSTPYEDLSADETFDMSAYPRTDREKKIEVIQLAEGQNGKVYLYTYEPAYQVFPYRAVQAVMSLSDSAVNSKLYDLTLVSVSDTLAKYEINNLTVSSASERYYNITSLYREFVPGLDGVPSDDLEQENLVYPVGKCWRVETVDGVPQYSCKEKTVIEIKNPYVGYCEYPKSFFVQKKAVRSYYISFDTDLPIDYLLEADVNYDYKSWVSKDWVFGAAFDQFIETGSGNSTVTVKWDDSVSVDTGFYWGWTLPEKNWDRIQTVDTFLTEENLTEAVKTKIKDSGHKWVLRFFDAQVMEIEGAGIYYQYETTSVENVTILRLKYLYDGAVYDVGAVMSTFTPGDTPSNNKEYGESVVSKFFSFLDKPFSWLSEQTGWPEWAWKVILIGIPILILLPVLGVIFPVFGQVLLVIVKALGKGLLYLGKGIVWVLSLPVKGIKALVEKIRSRKG